MSLSPYHNIIILVIQSEQLDVSKMRFPNNI